ncbi:MAG: DNA-3-methyladenine glycosylase I [Rhodoluna sp.]
MSNLPFTREFEDGLARCAWLNDDPTYIDYHDREWGVEVRGDQAIFERITLEGFQAGLSWLSILKRREGFRAAFANFELQNVANLTAGDVERLMLDAGIIRNRAKILSTINNAKIILEMQSRGESISDLVWSFQPSTPPRTAEDFGWFAITDESKALSKELRLRGFGFVGPTTMYAMMQAIGMVKDHAPGCFRRA